MELENYKRPWRLRQNFHITDEEIEAFKEQITESVYFRARFSRMLQGGKTR